MLHCIYHPIDDMRVVNDEERDKLVASGFWFDHPLDAKAAYDRYKTAAANEGKPFKGKSKKESKNE